ncbi:YncE family protein [Labilithrix luteola]|uniref:YncE family protein n=1 Tax=Labilithrix luteola TaxID=1391654 RepID=UPI0011BA4B8E|nr:YncE family protein [Labilithrix luteola]
MGAAITLVIASVGVFACSDDDPGSAAARTDDGDGGDGDGASHPVVATKLTRPSRGAGLDVSEDDTVLVAVNRDVGTVSVFAIEYPEGAPPTLKKTAEVPTCAEPWQVALAPSGDRAFVVCRKDQKVVRVDNLRSAPAKGPEVAVGSEPTGIALTPKATAAWVTNWMDGTVSEIDPETMTVQSTVDLNGALVGTGVLGQNAVARPALAHPRSLVITNNKDDIEIDESIFVTEYFAQQKEPLAADGSNADIARQGLVYRIRLQDKSVSTIPLPPIADIGIHDVTDGVAGCYPNQLQAIDSTGSFVHVLSICASPKGKMGDFSGPAKASCSDDSTCPGAQAGSCSAGTCQTNCTTAAQCGLGGECVNNTCKLNLWNAKSVQTPAVSVIDVGANKVIASVPLNSEFDKLYAAKGIPDTSERRFPLNPSDLAFVPGTLTAYMPAKGADAVFRVDFNATYETKAVDSVGSADRPFIQLDLGTLDAAKQGKLPIAIAIAHRAKVDSPSRFGFVLNEATRNVSVLDLKTDSLAGLPDQAAVVSSSPMPTTTEDQAKLEGKRLFGTGLGRWSFQGQGWGACESCHVDGLSDQVTWFHLRGARQTPSLDQTVNKKNPSDIRFHNWQANADEIEDHEYGALRVTLGGVGAVVKSFDLTLDARIAADAHGQAGLNGSMAAAANPQSPSTLVGEVCVLDDWSRVSTFIKSIRTPRKPSNLDPATVSTGQTLFEEGKCQGCHGGDKWTLSRVFYTPDANLASPTNVNKALKSRSWSAAESSGFPPALLPVDAGNAALQTMRYSGGNPAALDQMVCLLRPVGTFNVAEPGVGVSELRRDMATPAQGNEASGTGFNVPSLLGMGVNAPYFHAGNARTLEAALSDTFLAHHGALNGTFLKGADAATKRAALVEFLLSIDEETTAMKVPALGPNGGDFCSAP